MDCLGTYLIMTHAQTCDHIRAQSATEWTAPVHTWHMPKHVITFVFKVLRNGLPRYILDHDTCPNLWPHSCSKCYGMDCPGTYLTHAQTCDHVRVQSATEWTAPVHTSCDTHAETCDHVRFQGAAERTAWLHTWHMPKPVIQSATEWTASVHTWSWHMPKPVTTFVLKVLRNGLPRYILDTCPNMWSRSCSKCYGMDCLGTYLIMTHAQTCDHIRAQSATEWTAPVHT